MSDVVGEFGVTVEAGLIGDRQADRPGDDVLGVPAGGELQRCLLYTSPSPRDRTRSRMPSSA